MNLRQYLQIGSLTAACILLTSCIPTTGELWTWKSTENREIKAELVRYDRETKRVHWRMPDNSEGSSPLDSLSYRSKWHALCIPAVSHEAGWLAGWYTKRDPSSLTPFWLFLVFGILALILLDFLSFLLGASIFRISADNIPGYAKQIVGGLAIWILGSVVIAFAANQGVSQNTLSYAGLALLVVATLVSANLVSTHYNCGMGKGLGVILLYRMACYAFLIVIFPFISWTIDPLFLEPLRMI